MMRSECQPIRNRQRTNFKKKQNAGPAVSVGETPQVTVKKKLHHDEYTPPNPKRPRKYGQKRGGKRESFRDYSVEDILLSHAPFSDNDDDSDDDILPPMVEASDSDSDSDDDDDNEVVTPPKPRTRRVKRKLVPTPSVTVNDEDDSDNSPSENDTPLTDFLSDLRTFQWVNKLSEQTIKNLYELLKESNVADYIKAGNKLPEKHTYADKILQAIAGVEVKTYHGCPKCSDYIWGESDKGNECPRPGCTGRRRDDKGQAYQEVIHFPLKPRLTALLGCPAWKHNIEYENWRRKGKNGAVADVCDCSQWSTSFGSDCNIIKLHFCYDGFPLCAYAGSKSMTPAEFVVLSLPPELRYKVNNILISMLIPDGLSAEAQRNFFKKVIEVDLNPLYTDGFVVNGKRYRVQIFGQTLDLKGREKFLNQVSVQSYVGCAHCRVVFPKGANGPCFGIARQWLPPGHPLRQRTCGHYFQYASPQLAGPPECKDTAFVCAAGHRALEGGYEHYLGQKGFPLFASLRYYSYENMNIVDWMHNCGCLYKWIMKVIRGPTGDEHSSAAELRAAADKTARKQLKHNNIFPELWEDAPVYLDTATAALLRQTDPDAIKCESVKWCKAWWKACGKKVPKGTRVAELRAQVLRWREQILENPKMVISTGIHTTLAHTFFNTHSPTQ